ncbi:predicted protein [Postia placenta Mad-698-R]|uniref:Ribosomal RNA methyltransferase FtsJ domain-containing protein n=1 Tax=Postia placenta MAD-698-R-SB12 TaxID=670580 RepID=A0A1X6N0L5_9APHY|nr:hypothetical protein POSPLADRAFT_1143394 [Postia placenta MAD-698-R-SB12]EED82245.1 predicted protein [Postia placenta Mad-698-R]OSX62147.1 hypothetical protein POSPLADRAFT_1143394 [Postia placenta MAD-698-R-SB12]
MSILHIEVPSFTSIHEVDSFIAQSLDIQLDEDGVDVKRLEGRFWNESVLYRRLRLLKQIYGQNPAVDKRFDSNRQAHLRRINENRDTIPRDSHMENGSHIRIHAQAFEYGFSAINNANSRCFGGGRIVRFLDLGCSPGGFSSWLLKNNPGVEGVGITLPDERSQFPLQIDPAFLTIGKYQVRYADIIDIVSVSPGDGALPIIESKHSLRQPYDLVIAGAFPTMQDSTPWGYRTQLLVAQVFLIIANTAPGGSAIVLIKTKPILLHLDIIGLLRQAFDSISAHKAGKLHAVRSSCYLVCRGFHASAEEIERMAGKLRYALQWLGEKALAMSSETGGSSTAGYNFLLSADSPEQVFDTNDRFVLNLLRPVWKSQYDAIHTDLAKVLVAEYGATAGSVATHSGTDEPKQRRVRTKRGKRA